MKRLREENDHLRKERDDLTKYKGKNDSSNLEAEKEILNK